MIKNMNFQAALVCGLLSIDVCNVRGMVTSSSSIEQRQQQIYCDFYREIEIKTYDDFPLRSTPNEIVKDDRLAKKFKECSELRNYIGEQHLSQYIFESACGNAKVLLAVSILLNTDAQYHRFKLMVSQIF